MPTNDGHLECTDALRGVTSVLLEISACPLANVSVKGVARLLLGLCNVDLDEGSVHQFIRGVH